MFPSYLLIDGQALEACLQVITSFDAKFPPFFFLCCKTVLDSGFYAVDSGFQVMDFRFFVSGTRIPYSSR